MGINREVTVLTRLKIENQLSPELVKAKADAEAASASVQKLGNQRMGHDGAAANGANLGKPGVVPAPVPVAPPPTPADLALANSIARAEAETKKLIATQGLSRNEIQLWELKASGATEKQIANLKRLQAEEARGADALKRKQSELEGGAFGKDARETQERLAKIQRIAGLGAAAMASTGLGGPLGGVLTSTLGGAAAGAALGVPGAVIGAAIGGVTSLFSAFDDGVDKSKQAVESFRQASQGAANAIVGAEASVRRLRETGRITETELTSLGGAFAERIFMRPESERATAAREMLPAATAERERLERARLVPGARAPSSVWDAPGAGWASILSGDWMRRGAPTSLSSSLMGPTATAAEVSAARAAEEALRTAARSGIDRDSRAVSFGDAGSIRERLMADVGGATAPAERAATELTTIREILNRFSESPDTLGAIARLLSPAPV